MAKPSTKKPNGKQIIETAKKQSKQNEVLRPQEINKMKINLSTTIMSNIITFFVTLVLTVVGTWFLYKGIQSEAHQGVVKDMQIVTATVEKPLKK